MSEDGRTVVGVGFRSGGPTEGFVAYLPAPEPGSAALGLISIGALAGLAAGPFRSRGHGT